MVLVVEDSRRVPRVTIAGTVTVTTVSGGKGEDLGLWLRTALQKICHGHLKIDG